MALATTYVPLLHELGPYIEGAAKKLMIAVLFLIGLGLTKELIAQVGIKPFIQGFLLWIIVSAGTLGAILIGFIKL